MPEPVPFYTDHREHVPPENTPWGCTENREQLLPGIWQVSTAGHGGIWLAPHRVAKLPTWAKSFVTLNGSRCWFEEDCEVAIAICAFADEFQSQRSINGYRITPSEFVANAKALLQRWNPSFYQQAFLQRDLFSQPT
jgi:hypothetical protein